MKRTISNSLMWAFIFSLLPGNAVFLLDNSWFGYLSLPVIFLTIYFWQPYIFKRDGDIYFRSKPFKKARRISYIDSKEFVDDMFITENTRGKIWREIEHAQQTGAQ